MSDHTRYFNEDEAAQWRRAKEQAEYNASNWRECPRSPEEIAVDYEEISAAQQQADLSGVWAVIFPPRDPLSRIMVGIAMHPRFEADIRRTKTTESLTLPEWFGPQIIIDPRMGDTAEVYYTWDAWKLRCDEQNEWDAKPAQAAIPNP